MYMAGRFDAGGVPSLRDFVADVVKDVPDGQGTVYDRWRGGATAEVELKALGSGADFVPFQDHLGVPTLSVEFIGANGYGFGAYHSNYDTRTYAERVADPGFSQGVTLARVLGTLALRMAGADVLPFRFSHAATFLEADLARADRQDLSRSSALATRIREAAAAMEAAIDRGLASGQLPNARTAALNDRLARLEQQLTDDDGAPERRWYRHVVHGWNIYSLYDGQPFPGLESAIRESDAARVAREVERIERALARMLNEVEAASRLLTPG
jgi:N-acetylated-alpha-linked acidic dipeptidase